ncbi:DUF6498-containing protein [Mycobacterium sp. 21AC1]|uniref:DUF6498-containing protein n=1 Tax=[Mycobacterium] appelbergii TaxID=2939269 RepID=UPI0029392505|nr:DUF6498-containing protein [Mycobacterium sp. 21AC1]MDV3127074.1 DUF6498-containing protein [Mycobacterium sp. 21AC1]
MTRIVHALTTLAVIAVPALGWFTQDWSGATTLAVYWFETVAACLFILARIAIHQRWSPRRGHFRYNAPGPDGTQFTRKMKGAGRRGSQQSFAAGFALISLSFCAAHGVFLGTILFMLNHNGVGNLAEIDWCSVGFGCVYVLAFLAIDFLVDLTSLRQWSFWQLEQTANRAIGRVMVIHLTLLIGFVGIAVTGAPHTFFGVFVVLKSLSALSFGLPQWEPSQPPKWLSGIMNHAPNVHPGQRFEEFWAAERDEERQRRLSNERPWAEDPRPKPRR